MDHPSRRAYPDEQNHGNRFSWQLPLDESPLPLHQQQQQQQQPALRLDTAARHAPQHRQQQQHIATASHQRPQQAQRDPRYPYVPNAHFSPSSSGLSPVPQSPDTPLSPDTAHRQALLGERRPSQQREQNVPNSQAYYPQQDDDRRQSYPVEKQDHFAPPQQIHPAEYVPVTRESVAMSRDPPSYTQHHRLQEQQQQQQQQRGQSSPSPAPPTTTTTISSSEQQYPYHSSQPSIQPPLSPGPLPVKTEQDEIKSPISPTTASRRTTMPPVRDPNYVPHRNTMLQSPSQPMFSPDSLTHPTTLTSQHSGSLQLHQPGQIAHPNMNLDNNNTMTNPNSSSNNNKKNKKNANERDWKVGLCGGCGEDTGTCFEGLFCPCVVYGRTSYRLSQRAAKKDATDLLGWTRVNGSCLAMALSCGLCGMSPLIFL